jgi:uncharacterized membrane protein YhaH (DUF805 family)
MNFLEAVSTCFSKYGDFVGSARRPEFWWFFLFTVVVSMVLAQFSDLANGVFCVVTLVPSFSVGARRLHDTGRSGWWQLLWLVPLIGWIVLLVFFVQEGTSVPSEPAAQRVDPGLIK